MELEKILVPLDGSELAERILVQVQRLLVRADAEVTLLSVIPEAGATRLPEARRYLQQLRESLVENGARANVRVDTGEAAAKILEAIHAIQPSLVAMSTHGRTGLTRLTRGSVAERVLRHAQVPLLMANPAALPDRKAPRFERILVPLDLSELSASVIAAAVDVARLYDSELILLHSIETPIAPDPMVAMVPTLTHDEATAELEKFAARISGVRVRTRVVHGPPSITILDVIADERADLVAIASHGRSGISRWAFGSVAEQVLRHATCPLLVKKTARAPEDTTTKRPAAESARA